MSEDNPQDVFDILKDFLDSLFPSITTKPTITPQTEELKGIMPHYTIKNGRRVFVADALNTQLHPASK